MSQPAIYISAVTRELKSARELVAKMLRDVGCKPVYHEIVGSEESDLRDLLRQKIEACDGVIQLVGRCYGPEPPASEDDPDRKSYAQFEAFCGRSQRKQVWHLVLADDFPTDPGDPEPPELARLQAAYVEWLLAEEDVPIRPKAPEELKTRVHFLGRKLIADRAAASEPRTAAMPAIAPPQAVAVASPAAPSAAPAPPAAPSAAPAPPPQSVFDEDVQFTVYRPQSMVPAQWHTWLAFAHRGAGTPDEPDYAREVKNQAEAVLGGKIDEYATAQQESSAALPRESTITIVPSVDGLEFNPAQRNFVWREPVHREEFLARVYDAASPATIRRGKITFFLGALIVAEINVKVNVATGDASPAGRAAPPMATDRARTYRHIFASYSRRDTAIVEHFERLTAAFGDRYLRDVHTLRAGEEWWPGLEEMIRQADIFQLFWSSHSMRSDFVRKEWEYALRLGREHFVRPTFLGGTHSPPGCGRQPSSRHPGQTPLSAAAGGSRGAR